MIKKKFFISNLCWKKNNFNSVIDILKKEKISGIDFAPLNYFSTWKNILKKSRELSYIFKKKGIKVNALQGIFFKKDLNLFRAKDKKKITIHFKTIIKLCKIFKTNKIILGSVNFRNPKEMSFNKANHYFIIYFKYLNKLLKKHKIYLCVETIPKKYGEKYIYDISHLKYLISKINSSNIKINFDTSIYHSKKLEKHKFIENLENIKNVQISQPNFKYFDVPTKKNLKFLKILKSQKSIKKVSLEIIDSKFNKSKFLKSLSNLRININN
tara:strand:- start:1196 stop:2002 length:807 start_codon:yes stop_codon:yes gene_type:complete